MGDEITALIRNGDVHRLADLLGLLLRGGDNSSCVFQADV
jgi:hypothetical protein